MSKKKNQREEMEEPSYPDEEEEFEFDEEKENNLDSKDSDSEGYGSALEIGGDIHDQSPMIKKFIHIPKDVKYAFYDEFSKRNFFYKSKAYQTHNYVSKICMISNSELENLWAKHKEFFDIDNLEDLEEYFKDIGKSYLFDQIRKLPKDDEEYSYKYQETRPLLLFWYELMMGMREREAKMSLIGKSNFLKLFNTQLNESKENGYVDDVYSDLTFFDEVYERYTQENKVHPEIDDMGLLHDMMTDTELSKGKEGKMMGAMNTTINITRDINQKEETDEQNEKTSSGKRFLDRFRPNN